MGRKPQPDPRWTARADTKLARLMAKRGLTQVALCRRSGLSRQTLYAAYHGHRELSLATWITLALALNIGVAEIAPPAAADRIVAVA